MSTDRYGITYSQFATTLSAEIRREVFGEDIGQNSWLTADEQMRFARKAGLNIAMVSGRWAAAREKRRDALIETDGLDSYEKSMKFQAP